MVGSAEKGHIPQAAMSVVGVLGIDRKDHFHMLVKKEENQQGCPASVSCVEERWDFHCREDNSQDSH